MDLAPEDAADDAVLRNVRLITARGPVASLRRGLIILGGLALFIGVPILLAVLFFSGSLWATKALLPLLNNIGPYTLAAVIFIVTSLAFFRRTRAAAGVAYVAAHHYFAYGATVVFISLFVFGVGAVPIALLATALHGVWVEFALVGFVPVMGFVPGGSAWLGISVPPW
jgi:hypothetical protein